MGIIKYEALSLSSLKQLQGLVNDYILDGWEPIGGLAAIADPGGKGCEMKHFGTIWAQAMVRRSE